eukprot:scaffold2553_cov138-Cylindrotheca_fusiformis.AAC.4
MTRRHNLLFQSHNQQTLGQTQSSIPTIDVELKVAGDGNRTCLMEEPNRPSEPVEVYRQCPKPTSSNEDIFRSSSKRRCSNEREPIDSAEAKIPELPDPKQDICPNKFLCQLVDALHGLQLEPKPALSMNDFFCEVSEKQMAAYNNEVVSAVRDNDLDQLKRFHESGQVMDCFNRFGESLLNLACRRGFEDIVRYLLDETEVCVRSSDDCGRTPLHDACWNPVPQLKVCKWILEREPVLFFVKDRRGCTAFDYARPEHWPVWRKFLLENRDCLKVLTRPENRARLAKTV